MEVFLVISDLHLSGHRKENRYSYDKEMHVVFHKIVELIEKYKRKGFEVNLIFLGDIFDKSYKTPNKYGIDSSFFIKIGNITKSMYVVIGNHELNFYVNNPFWTCINTMQSERVCSMLTKNTQPLGYEDVFVVVDCLEVGDSVFHFNHFACEDSKPISGKKNFAFYHKSFRSQELVADAKMRNVPAVFEEVSISIRSIDVVEKYNYAFLGHMHWLYGLWKQNETFIYGLASLGRPHKDEVCDTFLERNIPAIIFKNDKYSAIEDNYFMLLKREESVIATLDQEEKNSYEYSKVINEAKKYTSIEDNPIKNIQNFVGSQPRLLQLFNKLSEGPMEDTGIIQQLLDIERRFFNGV